VATELRQELIEIAEAVMLTVGLVIVFTLASG
jgi:hypothetical protein